MTKNKKGKKKNKMAGRSRPDEAPVEAGENSAPVVAGDASENEDQADPPRATIAATPEPDGRTSDSGIESGRGSPGDDPGSSTASAKARIKTPPKITEEKVFEDAGPDSATKMNADESEQTVAVESLEEHLGSLPPAAGDDKEAEKPEETEQQDEEPEPEPEEKCEEQPRSSDNKSQSEPARKSVPPAADPKMKGASSIKRPKPKEEIKHPLEFPWTFWLSRRNVPWDEALCEVVSFDTIEDFWYYFSKIAEPKSAGEPIVLFKKGIRPEWEDPDNAHGSRWNISTGLVGIHAQRVWKELILLMIGGIQFGPLTPHLNGIYCGWKSDGIHYSVWLNTLDELIARRIGNIIHENLLDIFKKSMPMELLPIKGKKRPLAQIR